jgi:hypothetical protein
MEVIKIIVYSQGLKLTKVDDVWYVAGPNDAPPSIQPPRPNVPDSSAHSTITDIFGPALGDGMVSLYGSVLDCMTRPDIVQKRAKAKKMYYDALVAQGFTKDEAFRIILAEEELNPQALSK